MKAALALLPLLLLGANDTPERGRIFDGLPPTRFMGENVAVTIYANDVTQYCPTQPMPGYRLLGCHFTTTDGVPIIVLPNPCFVPDEVYALIACHELGHRNSWGANHEF